MVFFLVYLKQFDNFFFMIAHQEYFQNSSFSFEELSSSQLSDSKKSLDLHLLLSSEFDLDKENDLLHNKCVQQSKPCKPSPRSIFQNRTNCVETSSRNEKGHSYSFSKKPTSLLFKPSLKENRISMETRASDVDSLCNPAQSLDAQLLTNSNLLLAEQLQSKIKEMDMRITQKLQAIKTQFWQNRTKSIPQRQEASLSKLQRKQSLVKHLKKKPSSIDTPEAIKNCYLKFIPMRQILTKDGASIQNPRIIQSKILSCLSAVEHS